MKADYVTVEQYVHPSIQMQFLADISRSQPRKTLRHLTLTKAGADVAAPYQQLVPEHAHSLAFAYQSSPFESTTPPGP